MPTLDRAESKIDEFESLILWAMRQWMRAHRERCCATGSVLEAFEFSGLVAALTPLNRMMTLLTLASRRRLAIATSASAPLSIDELVLLRILNAARNGQRDVAESRLGMWMETGNAAAAAQAALSLAEAVYRPSRRAGCMATAST
ncbi:hypothetical protein NUH88_12760 [Nisaea acidiphila]|uniref:Uncharacterized protein n=1 Tax=Nisaea acidiphila TaxID=1862145 RepID=A0A9J7AMA4_9PROT|nr:hypothetical protein [Nisaea acidiphila]UUX48286.1 hypothetical protein NUH88_12760 [Nisaea acidiphila]